MWTKLIGTIIVCLPLPVIILMCCALYAIPNTDEISHWEYSAIANKVKECYIIIDDEFDDTIITRSEYNKIVARYDRMDNERQTIRAKVELIETMKGIK